MFTSLLTYSGIVTKTKAMEAHLIDEADYENISNLNSVTDFINFLKGQPAYKALFANYDERLLHRNEIEQIITNALYLDYARIFQFANIRQRAFMRLIFFRYEINILKSCLQNIFSTDKTYNLSVFEPFFKKHSSLDMACLCAAGTIEEFTGCLAKTRYYDLFRRIQQNSSASLYDYETQLDIYYFTCAWKERKHIKKSRDQQAFIDILGKEIDFLNILWIYRSKKYYDANPSSIYNSIIPIHYKLTADQLMNLVEAGSIEEMVSVLAGTYYKYEDLADQSLADHREEFPVETLYKKSVSRLYRSNMKKYPYSMCTIHHYLFIKELEIDRLTTALECIRYGLDSAEALDYILK